MSKWVYSWKRITRRMWFRASVYGILGVATALAGAFTKFLLPSGIAGKIGADSVGNILGILAASMLTVTVFSLSTMVSAYGAASSAATPRAARLLIEDTRAQSALATFMGAFLYSIVGLIALSTGIYGDSGRLVLFGTTIAVIVLITVTLLRAIEQLSRFGRMAETVNLVEEATRRAMQGRASDLWLGCTPGDDIPPNGIALHAERIGYVEHLDTGSLSELAEEHGLKLWLNCMPGAFMTPDRPLLRSDLPLDESMAERARSAFAIGDARSIDGDPRYGLVVLTEIALRAMSPAVNDPGTCIDIIGTSVRLLCGWADKRGRAEAPDIRYPRLTLPTLLDADLFDDVFPLIGREGAGAIEIGIRLQKAFSALAATGYPPFAQVAHAQAELALRRALQKLEFEPDRKRLREVARQVNGLALKDDAGA
ncbi:MAG: DUF2254 domain-containing protein [Pseudoxanthomonas sp.]